MWTAQEGHAHITKLLLDRGAKSTIQDKVSMNYFFMIKFSNTMAGRLGLLLCYKPVKMAI